MSVINHLKQRRIDKEKNFTARNGRFNSRDGAPGSGELRWVKLVSYGRSSREKKREKKGKRANAFRSKNKRCHRFEKQFTRVVNWSMNKNQQNGRHKGGYLNGYKSMRSYVISPLNNNLCYKWRGLGKNFCYMFRFQHWDIFNTSLNFRQFTLIF